MILVYIILKLTGGEKYMVALYAALIMAGRYTIDDVYPRYQDDVRDLLAAAGLDENGNNIIGVKA